MISVWGQKCCKITPLLDTSLLLPLLTFMNIIVSSENSMMSMRLHHGRFYPIPQKQPFSKRASKLDVYSILTSRKWSNIGPVSQGDDRTCLRSWLWFVTEPGTEADLLSCQHIIDKILHFLFLPVKKYEHGCWQSVTRRNNCPRDF